MCPCDAAVDPQLFAVWLALVFIADVQGSRLGVTLSVAVAASSSATSAEVSVVHVVGVAHECIAHGAEGLHGCQSDAISVVGAVAQVGVGLYAVACAALGCELEYEVVVAVVDARHTTQVTFLVVCLHFVDDIRRQVFHHRVVVARHEVAAVQLEFPDLLAVDRDFSVFVDFGARQHLYQCLDDRTLGHAEGVGIIDHGIVFDDHLRDVGGDYCLLYLHAVGLQRDGAQGHLTAGLVDRACVVLVAQECGLEEI